MPIKRQGGGFAPVYVPRWQYRGGQTILPAGSSVQADVPTGVTIFRIAVDGGEGYFEINGASASANSHGFIADQTSLTIGPISNLNRLDVFAAQGDTITLLYFEQSE